MRQCGYRVELHERWVTRDCNGKLVNKTTFFDSYAIETDTAQMAVDRALKLAKNVTNRELEVVSVKNEYE